MKASINRQERRFYSKDGLRMYRVFKNYRGDAILVIMHYSEEDASDLLKEIASAPTGKVYEVKGREKDSFPATGKYGWTLKQVCEFVAEQIEKRGHY